MYCERLLEFIGGFELDDIAAGCTAFVDDAIDSSQKRCSDAKALLCSTFFTVDVIDLVVSIAGSTVTYEFCIATRSSGVCIILNSVKAAD